MSQIVIYVVDLQAISTEDYLLVQTEGTPELPFNLLVELLSHESCEVLDGEAGKGSSATVQVFPSVVKCYSLVCPCRTLTFLLSAERKHLPVVEGPGFPLSQFVFAVCLQSLALHQTHVKYVRVPLV